MSSKYKIYTDGSAQGNPGPGGYGTLLCDAEDKVLQELQGGFVLTTNNRMELMALIAGIEALPAGASIEAYSDSRYVVDAISQGWLNNWVRIDFKKKKNKDLWLRYLEAVKQVQHIQLHWIKGHNEHPQNERCDFLAQQAKPSQRDLGYEQRI